MTETYWVKVRNRGWVAAEKGSNKSTWFICGVPHVVEFNIFDKSKSEIIEIGDRIVCPHK